MTFTESLLGIPRLDSRGGSRRRGRRASNLHFAALLRREAFSQIVAGSLAMNHAMRALGDASAKAINEAVRRRVSR